MSGCPFCQRRVGRVDYKDVEALRSVLKSDGAIRARRGKLNKKGKRQGGSGLCRKHHAQAARAVKRARSMALLPASRPAKVIDWPPETKQKR